MSQHNTQTTSWIQKTPGVCGGEACVRRTRYTVAGLVDWRRLGLQDDQILRQQPDLTQSDLDAAWEYYQNNSEEINQAIRDDEDLRSFGLARQFRQFS
jgi:type III restriction enzyme